MRPLCELTVQVKKLTMLNNKLADLKYYCFKIRLTVSQEKFPLKKLLNFHSKSSIGEQWKRENRIRALLGIEIKNIPAKYHNNGSRRGHKMEKDRKTKTQTKFWTIYLKLRPSEHSFAQSIKAMVLRFQIVLKSAKTSGRNCKNTNKTADIFIRESNKTIRLYIYPPLY